MPELPVPKPMYGVRPNDTVQVVQKMDPSGGNRGEVQQNKLNTLSIRDFKGDCKYEII